MGLWDDLLDKFQDELSGAADERRADAQLTAFNRNYSVRCRQCSKLADPIAETSNRYRCACGNQFAGAHHGGWPKNPY